MYGDAEVTVSEDSVSLDPVTVGSATAGRIFELDI